MLEKFDNQRWPAMTLELTMLGISTGLMLKDIVNSYILISFVMVLSTFALQTINVRFLWLYPIWIVDKRPTERADTYLLKFYLLFSSLFLALGVYHWFLVEISQKTSTDHAKWLQHTLVFWDSFLTEAILYVLIIFGLIVPLIFFFFINKKIRKKLNKDQNEWLTQLKKSADSSDKL